MLWKRLTALFAALAFVGANVARAQDAASYFAGRTIHFVVGVGVGGGYDAYARMLAPHLARELNTNVVVDNIVGAGGLLALNRLAARDGDATQIMIVNGTPAALGQLLGEENARYDLRKFGHLGMINVSPWMWLVSAKSPLRSVADARASTARLRWGGTGVSDGMSDGAALTCEGLRISCQIILGYKGSSDVALAMERGEVDALYLSDNSSLNYVNAGQARAIATMARTRSTLLPDTPTVFEQAAPDADQAFWLNFRADIDGLGRLLVTAAGLPPDRLAYLRGAVRRVLTDPAVIAEGARTQRFVAYQPPETALALIDRVLATRSTEQFERLRRVVLSP